MKQSAEFLGARGQPTVADAADCGRVVSHDGHRELHTGTVPAFVAQLPRPPAQLIHPVSQLLFLQKAEARLQFPAGSLSEALGIGDAARLRLEEILSQLVLTVPEVRAQLRGMTLPVRNPQLRELITRTLQQPSATEERPDSLA
jgi:hypothetical protein